MNTSIILAQILGIIFAATGLSVLFNKKSMVALIEESTAHKGFLWLTGFIALAMGAVLVGLNNSWTSNLQLSLAIIGWLAVAKGLFISLLPNATISLYKKFNNTGVLIVGGFIAIIIGAIFLYVGFVQNFLN